MECNCSYRSTSKILNLLNDLFGWNLSRVPCANTITNWVEKSGYHVYKSNETQDVRDDYTLIVDESMMVNNQRLLMILSVPTFKLDEGALKVSDVRVVDMCVRERWDGDGVAQRLKSVSPDDCSPTYILSDNESKLKKAGKSIDLPHLADVGHSLALCLEQTYKSQDDFIDYMKGVAKFKNKYSMTSLSYLLPPNQRIIARFMNLEPVLKWSVKMRDNLHLLGEDAKNFALIGGSSSLIDELDESFSTIDYIQKKLKKEGIDEESVEHCLNHVNNHLSGRNMRQRNLASLVTKYLREQKMKLESGSRKANISTDIIESMFSVYKRRKCPNHLCGVTGIVLLLPLMTKCKEKGIENIDFKKSMEDVFLNQIKSWKFEYLSENKQIKRNLKLVC